MPETIRFHLDEHISAAVAAGLRQHGLDVTTSTEANLLGCSDAVQIVYAIEQTRVIVTNDSDFLRHHQ